jgi:site-specific DNA-cytosine methylase
MRLLELFCGTKSVGKAMANRYDEIISLDILPSAGATITTDILTWDYHVYPAGHFDAIWASPPCTEYSHLNYANPYKVPNVELADSIVRRTFEIITYFNPAKWFVENPQSGTLKGRDVVAGIPFRDFDYCCYSDWGYRKRTRFWTNQPGDTVLCGGRGACPNMEGGRHKKAIGNSGYVMIRGLNNRHAIPPNLIVHLFE